MSATKNTLKVIDTVWDHNGTLTVRVAAPWPRTGSLERRARYLARQQLSHPEITRSSRLTHVSLDHETLQLMLTYRVSRLAR